eukprot:scaffold273006_cov47-Attheya_sp.AAC.1
MPVNQDYAAVKTPTNRTQCSCTTQQLNLLSRTCPLPSHTLHCNHSGTIYFQTNVPHMSLEGPIQVLYQQDQQGRCL